MASVDRPIKDIIDSVMLLTAKQKMPEQLRRDLEKLCCAAFASPHYEREGSSSMSKTVQMRAKVAVGSVFPYRNPETGEVISETLTLHGVAKSDGPYPADGSDENNSFARWSPSVKMEFLIANPALFGGFEPGDTFYVDFTPAPK